jgi:hypothetical protein
MSRQTLTGELRETLLKIGVFPYKCYSDSRKHKTAIGVKLVDLDLDKKEVKFVVKDMKSKGYELARVTPDRKINLSSGTRLTFYKKEFSFLDKK